MKLNDVTVIGTIFNPPPPELGKLLVWNAINPPSEMRFYSVDTIDEAKKTINHIANEQLQQEWITDNALGLMVGSEDANKESEITWYEWEDDDGFDISESMDEDEDEKEECDDNCLKHAPGCDGNCDHLSGHINSCMRK